MAEAALQTIDNRNGGRSLTVGGLPLPVTWRDPHSVPKEILREKINDLEVACVQNPGSADLWTCLGMAYAMDFRVTHSMKALSQAIEAQPEHFWARFKMAELSYRLRTLELAETETMTALDLATSNAEISIARRQLQEIRRLRREGTQKPTWSKPLQRPALIFAAVLVALLLCGLMLRP